MRDIPIFFFLLLIFSTNLLYGQPYWSKNYDFFEGVDAAHQLVRTSRGVAISPLSFCDKNSRECVGLIEVDLDGNLLAKTVVYDSLEINSEESITYWKDTFWIHTNYIKDSLDRRIIIVFDKEGYYVGPRYTYTYPTKKGYNFARQIAALRERMFITFLSRKETTATTILRAFDKHLNILWDRELPLFYKYSRWHNIRPTPDGGVIAITSSTQNWEARALITKFDADGNQAWQTPFKKNYGDRAESVKIQNHPDGGYVGLWQADSFALIYDNPAVLFKMNAMGQFEWQKVDFGQVQEIVDIFAAKNGDLIMCGFDQNSPFNHNEYFAAYLRRMNAQGDIKWERRIFDNRDDARYNLLWAGLELENGDLMFTGSWHPFWSNPPVDSFPENIWLIKVDSNGCFSPNCDTNQYVVSAYEPLLIRDSFKSFAVFPSPFEQTLNLAPIVGQPIPAGNYDAAIYDVLGRQVRRQMINPNLLNNFDLSEFSSGIYTIVIFLDGKAIQTLKVIKS